jgi:hypothetical protein
MKNNINDYLEKLSEKYSILESTENKKGMPPLPPIPPPCREIQSFPFVGDIETKKSINDYKLFISLKERRLLLNKRLGF